MQPPNADACSCGSGLRALRCCLLSAEAIGANTAHQHLIPLEQQADRAYRAGDQDTALRLALDVLELAPIRPGPLRVLYEIRRKTGAHDAAQALIRRLVALQPNDLWAVNEAALLLLERGSLAEAEMHARNAVRIAPESAQAHNVLGMVLTEAHRPAVAEYHYGRALALSGSRAPTVLANFALCLKNQGKMAEARALYQESLTAEPNVPHTLLGLARLEEADRKLPAALTLLDRADACDPGNPSSRLLRAVVLGRMGEASAALSLLDGLAEGRPLAPAELLEKGRLLDKVGRYDEAFAAYDEGKQRLRYASGQSYRAEHAMQTAARLRGFFTARRLRTLPGASVRDGVAQPLFVLGFPRSGTTLLEQMLTTHPRIAAGDELPIIAELTALMPRLLESPLSYPEALAELWMGDHRDDLDILRDHYLRRVSQLGIVPEGARWFTDKMPLNETDLGLIALLFPRSPLLRLVRHPLDVVLSVYSNLLTHGFHCAYALETAAQHYVLVHELVEHYRRQMPLRFMEVRYEDLIDDQEATLRRVLAFMGEEFDRRCLAFHENRRYARTASYAQVSEVLYSRSKFRYRHYLKHLQPAIDILGPTMEKLGYAV